MVIPEMTQINLHALHGGFCVERNIIMRNIEAIKTRLDTSKYSKPYLNCEEQLLLLKDRGIKIEDEKFALQQLETISYYSLINAYTPLFLKIKMNMKMESHSMTFIYVINTILD